MRFISVWFLVCAMWAEVPGSKSVRSSAVFPLVFERHGANYVSRGGGYELEIGPDDARFDLRGARITMRCAGAAKRSKPEGLDRMPGHATYRAGHGAAQSFELYGRVRRAAVYRGIDLIYHGNQERIEYDFLLDAGASPDAIALVFDGASTEIEPDGALTLRAGDIEIRQPKPEAWQVSKGQRIPVEVNYRIDQGRVGLSTGPYDRSLALVIDPTLVTQNLFQGGTSTAKAITLDGQGNAYVTGSVTTVSVNPSNPVQLGMATAPLLSSADAGATWKSETLGSAYSVGSLVAAPGDSSILYAATEQGVARSSDGGRTWTTMKSAGLPQPIAEIAVDAGSASMLYAAAGKSVYVSNDSGDTWTGSTTFPASFNTIMVGVQSNPQKPGTVYAMTVNPFALVRSVDGGKTWAVLDLSAAEPFATPAVLAFSPASPDLLVLGESGGGIIRSNDGGATWSRLSNQSVANIHGLVMDPTNPSNLFLLNGAGVQKSIDGGATWRVVNGANGETQYNPGMLTLDPRNPRRLYLFNVQGLFTSSDAGETWSAVVLPYSTLPGTILIAPADSSVLLGVVSAGESYVTKWNSDLSQVLYMTYFGGSGGDVATAIAVDASGSAYVTGYTSSPDFRTTANAYQTKLAGKTDAFVVKLSADGSKLAYSTLLGGGAENATAIGLDAGGAAYIAGSVQSSLPVTANALQKSPGGKCTAQANYVNYTATGDGFLAKISADGKSLIYSTYLGGGCGDSAASLLVNQDGSVWVGGVTWSPDFPVTADALQSKFGAVFGHGFLARVSAAGDRLEYSTLLGGGGFDEINAIAKDTGGNLYLTGVSMGLSQPASPGAFQASPTAPCIYFNLGPPVFNLQGNAFVMRMNSTATAVTGLTYLGSPCLTSGVAIAVDATGAPWIGGLPGNVVPTVSPFEVQLGGGFVSKLSPDLTQLLFSTYTNPVSGLAVDAAGKAFVVGSTPQAGIIDSGTTLNANTAYVAKFDPAPPPISLDNVVSASLLLTTGQSEAIAPGKVVRLSGKGFGPAQKTPGTITAGVLTTSVAGVQVTFDGVSAPLLYVSATEIECLVPFAVTNPNVSVQVIYNNVKSNAMLVPIRTQSGVEVLAILNQDFTLNSSANPAAPGSYMSLYISGAGQTVPPSKDGQVYGFPLPAPVNNIMIQGAGFPLLVTFAGGAPGLASGIFQVNFQAPGSSSGATLSGGVSSTSFYIYIQ